MNYMLNEMKWNEMDHISVNRAFLDNTIKILLFLCKVYPQFDQFYAVIMYLIDPHQQSHYYGYADLIW